MTTALVAYHCLAKLSLIISMVWSLLAHSLALIVVRVQLQSFKVEHGWFVLLNAGLLENEVLQLILCVRQAQVAQ